MFNLTISILFEKNGCIIKDICHLLNMLYSIALPIAALDVLPSDWAPKYIKKTFIIFFKKKIILCLFDNMHQLE